MADKPHSDEQAQQAEGPTPISAVGPAIEQTAKPAHAPHGEEIERSPRESLRNAAIRVIKADWQRSGIAKLKAQEVWPLFLGFMAIAVAAFTLRILAGQLNFMELQLSEMQSGGEDTNALARAAKRQAESTHDLAIAASKQADRTKDLVDRMKDQADRTRDIANTSRAALIDGQRAYVFVSSIDTTAGIASNGEEAYSWTLTAENSGATNARDLQMTRFCGTAKQLNFSFNALLDFSKSLSSPQNLSIGLIRRKQFRIAPLSPRSSPKDRGSYLAGSPIKISSGRRTSRNSVISTTSRCPKLDRVFPERWS